MFWNSRYRLEIVNFLPISTYREFSQSILGLENGLQFGVTKFHQSRNLPGNIWNSGIPLDMGDFVLNLTNLVSSQFNILIGSILWFVKPGIQESWIFLDSAGFCWLKCIVYFNPISLNRGSIWPRLPKPVYHAHNINDRIPKNHDFVPFETF